jgi:hypothetical protein
MTEELEKLFKRQRKAGVEAVYTKTAFKALYELSKSFHSESPWGFQLYQVHRHSHIIIIFCSFPTDTSFSLRL